MRAQSQAVIGDLEASVRILGVSMESAVANIAEMLSALEQLRSHTGRPDAVARLAGAADRGSSRDAQSGRRARSIDPGQLSHSVVPTARARVSPGPERRPATTPTRSVGGAPEA